MTPGLRSSMRVAGSDAGGIGVVQWVLAALLLGAGAVHLALAPSHFGESAAEGLGFLVAARAQLALAVLVLFRPSRTVVGAIADGTFDTDALGVARGRETSCKPRRS